MDDPNDLVFAGGSGWLAGRDHDFEYQCLSARLPDYQCQRNDRLFASNQPILFVVRNGEYQRNRNFRFVCGWILRLMSNSWLIDIRRTQDGIFLNRSVIPVNFSIPGTINRIVRISDRIHVPVW